MMTVGLKEKNRFKLSNKWKNGILPKCCLAEFKHTVRRLHSLVGWFNSPSEAKSLAVFSKESHFALTYIVYRITSIPLDTAGPW